MGGGGGRGGGRGGRRRVGERWRSSARRVAAANVGLAVVSRLLDAQCTSLRGGMRSWCPQRRAARCRGQRAPRQPGTPPAQVSGEGSGLSPSGARHGVGGWANGGRVGLCAPTQLWQRSWAERSPPRNSQPPMALRVARAAGVLRCVEKRLEDWTGWGWVAGWAAPAARWGGTSASSGCPAARPAAQHRPPPSPFAPCPPHT